MTKDEIETATREELITYLENWGTACYDYESTELLREAALENYYTEGY